MALLRRTLVTLGLALVAVYLLGSPEAITHVGVLLEDLGAHLQDGWDACIGSSRRIGW
jgi:hypothetical protein